MTKTVLVAGATGATGRHVVSQLLEQGHTVKAVVRSKDKMTTLLSQKMDEPTDYGNRLQLTEASLLDLSDAELQSITQDCDAVVSCLGHTMDMPGLFGRKDRRLVSEATKRLTAAMKTTTTATTKQAKKKFILMSSNGVSNPNLQDDPRPLMERALIFLVRHLITPHADNEEAAQYLHDMGSSTTTTVEWCAVRPDDLLDGDVTSYELVVKPKSGLFGANVSTRSNVAHAMVRLVLDEEFWNQWKFRMPVHADTVQAERAE